jgi:hypothetical protein
MLQFKEENGFPISVRSVSWKVKYVAGELTKELNKLREELENDPKKLKAVDDYMDGFNAKLIELAERIHDLGETRSLSIDDALTLLKSQDKAYASLLREKTATWIAEKKTFTAERNSLTMTHYRAVLGGLIEGLALNFAQIFENSELSRPRNLEKLLHTQAPSFWCNAFPNIKKRWTGTNLVDFYSEKGVIERLKKRVEALQQEGTEEIDMKEIFTRFAHEIYKEEEQYVFGEIDSNLQSSPEISQLKENTQVAIQTLIQRDNNVERFAELYAETRV